MKNSLDNSREDANAPIPEPKDLIDFKVVLGWLLLCVGFVKKRKWIVVTSVFLMGGLGLAALMVMPKTFSSTMTMLATRNEYLSPDRRAGWLTDSAPDIVNRRENIAKMVKETNLVQEWKTRRGTIGQLKDDLIASVFGPMSDEDIEGMLVDMVGDRLLIEATRDTVTITVEWREPDLAAALAIAASNVFLEERRVQEISLLAESTAILEKHAAELEKEIKSSIENIRSSVAAKEAQAKEEMGAAQPAEPVTRRVTVRKPEVARPSALSMEQSARLAALNTEIDSQKKLLDREVAESEKRVGDLYARLQEQRAIYKDAHPAITDLKQQIATAEQDSPTAMRLRSAIQQLESEQAALVAEANAGAGAPTEDGGGTTTTVMGGDTRLGGDVLRDLRELQKIDLDDPELEYVQSRVNFAVSKYNSTMRDIDGARLDLQKAQAAFKYRYRIVKPAQVPGKPIKPEPVKIVLGALMGGFAVGILLALALELRHGLIYEPWQIESSLDLPVVASVNLLGPGEPKRS